MRGLYPCSGRFASLRTSTVWVLLSIATGCASTSPCPAPAATAAAPATAPRQVAATATPASAATPATGSMKIDDQHPVDRTRDVLLPAMNAKDLARIDELFSANMRKALPREKLSVFLDGLLAKKGVLGRATPVPNSPASATHAFYDVTAERGVWRMELTVANDGTILGLTLKEPPAPEPDVQRSDLRWSLPFTGEWTVVWGGATEELNQHVRHKSQRRAADLLVTDGRGDTHKGDGKTLADYYAYGKPVLAALEGKVVYAVDGLPDNAPGATNPYMAFGNVVVLEHAGNMHSAYAHLRAGSLKVKAGTRVKAGQVIATCGNSGNSTEPHLHFQIMDGPRLEASYGVEPAFANVRVTRGEKSERMDGYSFLKGDKVSAGDPIDARK